MDVKSRARFAITLSKRLTIVLLAAGLLSGGHGIVQGQLSTELEHGLPATPIQGSISANGPRIDWKSLSRDLLTSTLEMPRRSRVSRTHQPLRQVTLIGGDHFVAEFLGSDAELFRFRLLSGQIIRVPVASVASLANPSGEIDVVAESFERNSSGGLEAATRLEIDDTRAADGESSLRLSSSFPSYRKSFLSPLSAARMEFSFQTSANDGSSASGEWQIDWAGGQTDKASIVVQVDANQRITVRSIRPGVEMTIQPIKISAGWHSFIAIVSQERTRLIVDEAILASFPTPGSAAQSLELRLLGTQKTNFMWIDALHISRLEAGGPTEPPSGSPSDSDVIRFPTGDELFGNLTALSPTAAMIELLGQRQSIPWNEFAGVEWRQPAKPIWQTFRPKSGLVARVEMQPFDDRPECEPERWTVTVLRVDAERLIAQHSLIGELEFRCSEIRRVNPAFYGQTLLVDARRFHLGNSIRPDLHRQLPDGTHLLGTFRLNEIPDGQTYLTLDVAELEAGSSDAPPASPFLANLRAGQLVTELLVNDHRIGEINSLIRFKANSQSPDRIRFKVPRELLKIGENSYQFRQQPLKPGGREFDDGEVGNLRLELESR